MTNDPTSAAYEAQLKIKRDLQLLKGEDDQYVLSTFASMYALPKLATYIQQAIAEAETRGRISELKWALSRTSMDELVARYKELQANADGANGRDGDTSENT